MEWQSEHMAFQFWPGRVQWSQSPGGAAGPGFTWNQRFAFVSQAAESAWSRPPGKGTRYCCSGATPKV